ncbi:MAG: response regulator, partial [Sandaracinus sp.]|nr:response regulator [Sandaracinus sp.]
MTAEILLVEDDDAHAELIARSLERVTEGLRLQRVADGEAAVARLEAQLAAGETLPRLILLDLRLPRMGGREVLEHVKEHPVLRRVPVVVLTTSKA